MGTHLVVCSGRFHMNTDMAGFKHICVLELWMILVSALEGFIHIELGYVLYSL